MKLKSILKFLMIILVISGCNGNKENDNLVFSQYYAEFQKNNYSEYDSLLNFYNRLDTVTLKYKSDLLWYLKKTTEGRLYFRKGEYKKSSEKYAEANRYIEPGLKTDTLRALNIMSIGLNFMNQTTYDSAFYYFQSALNVYEKSDDRRMIHVVKANIAQAYYNKHDTPNAMRYINEIVSDSANVSVKLGILHLKANILGSTGSIDSAMMLDREMILKYGNEKNNYLISSFYNNLGMCFLEKGLIDSALYYCKKSYEVDSLGGVKLNMAANQVLMADIYRNTGQTILAFDYLNRALKIFSDDSNVDKKYWIYGKLVEWAKQDNNLKMIAQYQDSMLVTYRKMNDLEVSRTIELLNIEYETDRKNQQIEVQQSQLKGQRIALLFTLLTVLLIIVILWFYFQNKDKRIKLQIAEQESKVSAMLIEAEQSERSRIARDLHDGVSQKLAVMKMHLSLFNSADNDAVDRVSTLLDQTITDVRSISHNLYPKDLDKGIIIALENLCEQNNFINQEIKFNLKIDSTVTDAKLSPNIELVIYRLVQEITNNALKYSKASKVEIKLAINNHRIELQISDDGIGFSKNDSDNTKGIGLTNIFERIKQISGKVTVLSQEKKGTQFLIEIPA